MSEEKLSHVFRVGDRVKIRRSMLKGPIVELRGPLGPGGALIFRVMYRGKPRPAYIEVREDQLKLIRAKEEAPAEGPPAS